MFKKLIDWIKYGSKKFYLYDEKDVRNFGSDVLYTPVREDVVDKSFIVFDPTPQDQTDSDFCAGYSGAYAAEPTEGEPMAGAFLFAKAKQLSGSYDGFGTSILQICKARQKFGVCKKALWDYPKGKRDFFANWYNLTEDAINDALKHKSKAYFELIFPRGWDTFDTIRAYLWHFKDGKILIQSGRDGHACTLTGYDAGRKEIVGRDSYGLRTYENGKRYFDRSFANGLFTPYFSVDMDRSLAEILVEYNNKAIKLTDNPDCYLVKDGKKRLLPNEAIAWSAGVLLFSPDNVYEILKEDFDKIFEPFSSEFKLDYAEPLITVNNKNWGGYGTKTANIAVH